MVLVEKDDLFGSEDVSSDGEDSDYEPEFSDKESVPFGSATVRRQNRKRARETSEKLPLMDVVGKSFRILGFNQRERVAFLKNIMRFGFEECVEVDGLDMKTADEIHNYRALFYSHLLEEESDSPTFSDGVPKEGLIRSDLLVRMETLRLFREKVNSSSDCSPLFTDDIVLRFPELREGRIWKEHHDRLLLQAVLKHGYERWQEILDDEDLKIQQVICRKLNLFDINAPLSRHRLRELQRRQVEFIKERILLLEEVLTIELAKKIFYAGGNASTEESEHEGTDTNPAGSNAERNIPSSLNDPIPDEVEASSSGRPAKLRVRRKSYRP